MNENNEVVATWLRDIKATMERYMEGGARPNGESRAGWDEEDQGMLSEVQSFGFLNK